MKKQNYELVFRMPEDIFRPGAIEFMNAGGYGEMNFVFVHGIPNIEIYSSKSDFQKAGARGLALYSSETAVNELVLRGGDAARQLADFIATHPDKDFKKYNTGELCQTLSTLYRFWAPFNTSYSYTEFVYFHEVERVLREQIVKEEQDPHRVSEVLHLILSHSLTDQGERDKAIKALHLPPPLLQACSGVIRISTEKLVWRETLNVASQYFKSLSREIARRFYMSPKQIESCFYKELEDLFAGKEIDIDVINRRADGFVAICKNKKLKWLLGEKAKKFRAGHIPSVDKNIRELRGDVVCAGIARGRAIKFTFGFSREATKEINKKIESMHKGDIVVTESTGPELIMACRKAGAIITEEGGINSHAAVISRELKIPAIVNTKIATQVINDGDLIEVDANSGIISILSN